jgi:predicted permease
MTFPLRSLAQARGFTITAVLTLGVGLALCLIVAAVANAYLFRPLPYPAADRLYNVQYAPPDQRLPHGLEALDWASLGDVVEHPIAWDLDVFYLLGGAYPESAPGAWVTPGYVHAFGVRAALGRDLVASDFDAGRPMVALISHRLWQSRFGGDPAVVGRRLSVYVSDRPDEPESIEVVGVMRADFWHVNAYTEVLAPLRAASFPYLLQLRKGVPPSVAADRVSALASTRVSVVPFQSAYVAAVRPVVWAIGAAAALVLVIACANVAVLMLVRGQRRERDVALRLALGASRAQVLRLLLAEALWLGGAATAVGVAIAAATLDWLVPYVEGMLERRVPGGAAAVSFDPQLALIAAACGVAATLAFALVPAVATWRHSLLATIAAGGRSTGTPGRARARSVLIGLEVAVSLTLVTGALLMTVSALRMLAVDFGIRADAVTTAGLSLRQQSYPDPQARAAVFERVLDRLSALAGGREVAIGDWWPLQAPPPRQFAAAGGAVVEAGAIGVTPGYFSALGIELRDGRAITRDDRLGGEPVVVLSETLARRLWPSSRAVGETVRVTRPMAGGAPDTRTHRVVGVAADVRQTHADTSLLDAYVPLLQEAGRFAFAYLPAPVPSPAWERELRQAVAEVDPEIAVGVPRGLQAALDRERLKPRVLAWLLSAFALSAALLALLGMASVVAYAVRQREREVAVRMAVGADQRAVTALFVRQGSVVLAAGVAAGVLGAVGMGRVLTAQLYGVGRADPLVIAGAAAVLSACGLAAIWWPARRAAATDPAVVLKAE